MLSKVASTSLLSWVLAPLTASPTGTPWPSVNTERFVPRLPRSVGFFPVFFPPERGFGHRPVHRLPLPVDALQGVVLFQRQLPEFAKHLAVNQPLEVAMEAAPGTEESGGHGFSLATRAEHEENAVTDGTPRQRRPSTLAAVRFALRQQRFQAFPQRIGNPPAIVNL